MACSYALMPEDLRIAISTAALSDTPIAVNPSKRARVSASLAPARWTAPPPLAMACPVSVMRLLPCTTIFVAIVDANHSQNMHNLAVLVSNDLARPYAPADCTIAVYDSMLKHDVSTGLVVQCLAHRARHGIPVVGMDQR